MSAFHTLFIVGVAVAAISIAILMLDDVFAELDRRRRVDEILAELSRVRRRHS
jgi:recombinational DNA repair ATPase RecF